jgi:hypothetical protein
MGCEAKWPEEKFGIIHPRFDPGNQHHTFMQLMHARCAKGGTWDNCWVNGEWNYGNLP